MVDQAKNQYDIAWERAAGEDTREEFWKEQAKLADWKKFPNTILDKSNPNKGFWRWYPDGEINICYNCIDRHQDLGDKPALHWYSAMVKQEKTYSWKDLLENVSKLAWVYQKLGVKTGDRVIVYCPQIPEGIFGMLAAARIGAIHSVVFGGFAAKELASRIVDARPSLIISASCGLEPNKVINYKEILDEALDIAQVPDVKTLIVQREVQKTDKMVPNRDFSYYQEMASAQRADCVYVKGSHYLYILYTSGTTGQPKGIVRDQGGTSVAVAWTMKHIMNIKKGDVYFSTSDIGWVVGHTFIVYGPLCVGATTVLYEGKPTGTPDAGAFWRIIEKYGVNGMYSAPTALRAIRREDPDSKQMKNFNIKSLKGFSMAGERCDVPTYEWIQNGLGVMINDNYWQTEIGWIISCNYFNLHTFKCKPGSAIKPAPGFVVHILDNDNNVVTKPNELGRICCKLPMPPSFMLTLYNNDDAFKKKYLEDSPGYYQTGDCGYFDEFGYLNVMTRIDDIINTAGHRLSTAQMEEVLLGHPDIVEAAVVAKVDSLKGEIPIGFVVIKQGRNPNPKQLEKDCIQLVRKNIGPVAAFQYCMIVEKLPKTRSGKILRHCLKKLVDGQEITKVPATIEDASTLTKIGVIVKDNGMDKTLLDFGDVNVDQDKVADLSKE